MLCLVYYYGVHVGNVYAVLHNGGCYEHIVVVVYKGIEYLLQLGGFHLSVAYAYAGIGHGAFYHPFQFIHIGYAVVYEEHLPVTAQLKVYGLLYHIGIEGLNFGVYGVAVGWWRLYHREVACAHNGKLQCAGDGGGCHSERVHVYFELSQLLLHGHTEFLLLVYD